MRTIAMATFLGSAAMTGVGLTLLWGLALQQSVALVIIGPPLMLLSSGIALTLPRESMDDQMQENRRHLRLSRGQPQRRPLGPVRLPSTNGHRTWPRTAREVRR
jgi:hypothetical protein